MHGVLKQPLYAFMIFEIKPLESVGKVKFGMSKNETNILLGLPNSINENVHYYFNNCLQIHFEHDLVSFIEIANSSELKVNLMDLNIFEMTVENLIPEINNFYELDHTDPEKGYSYIFPKIEVSFWRSVIQENGSYFESIGIGKQGYYSEVI